MNLSVAFFLGFLGSLHCAAMCGPLMVALPRAADLGRHMAGRMVYHLGRVMTYVGLGVVAGWVGRTLFLAGLERWVSVALGIAVLAGFLGRRKIAAGAMVFGWVNRLKQAMGARLHRGDFQSLAGLGLLNGLLPCGLTYVAMAGATAQGSVLSSAAYMAVFGLGTWPMLLGISLSGRLLPAGLRLSLRRLIPAGVCLLGTLLILRGLALGIPYLSPDLSHGGGGCCGR